MAFLSNAQAHLIFKTVSTIFLGLLDQVINDQLRVGRNVMAKILDPQNNPTKLFMRLNGSIGNLS